MLMYEQGTTTEKRQEKIIFKSVGRNNLQQKKEMKKKPNTINY
jgi:hypothetical protein